MEVEERRITRELVVMCPKYISKEPNNVVFLCKSNDFDTDPVIKNVKSDQSDGNRHLNQSAEPCQERPSCNINRRKVERNPRTIANAKGESIKFLSVVSVRNN